MKYVWGLHESIQKELKLFKIEDVSKASMKAMGIKDKNQLRECKKGDQFNKGCNKSN